MLHGLCFGEEAGARNFVFFRVNWLQAAMIRYLLCAAGAAAVGLLFFFCRIETVASSCFGCACACVLIGVFWNLWLQIALEWLHDCCHLVLICA